MEINKKYTFIHPTKTGGTACKKFLEKKYSEYFTGFEHNILCSDNNNSIIIVRNIHERFFSMFNYWKNGSELYKRNTVFTNKNKNKTIIMEYIKHINFFISKIILFSIITKNILKK